MPGTQPTKLRTDDEAYTQRLLDIRTVWWKRLLDVQAPYRLHIRALAPGLTLDVGCGIGRNLGHLKGRSVGVDHNPTSVRVCRSRGLPAFTPEEFQQTDFNQPGRFDVLLFAHVLEHVPRAIALDLVRTYAPLVKKGGRLLLVTPQEAGYRKDPTHMEFVDFGALDAIARAAGFTPSRAYSFPFPRAVGRVFPYNEFISVSEKR